jgi:hypothetical protein
MKIIREKISKGELLQIADFIFVKSKNEEDDDHLHSIKEIIAIGKRDCGRFVDICNYYLTKDYKLFQTMVKPMLEGMINDYRLKKRRLRE